MKYTPDTEAAGSIARDSVRAMPVCFSTSISLHIVSFSVWSGWLGYPGAGRIPCTWGYKHVPNEIRNVLSKLLAEMDFVWSLLLVFTLHMYCVGTVFSTNVQDCFLQNVSALQNWSLFCFMGDVCRKPSYICRKHNIMSYKCAGKFPTNVI